MDYADGDVMADGVMMDVARDMGLINPVDIQILEEFAHLPTRYLIDKSPKHVFISLTGIYSI
jgi:hypothetical protein